MSEDPFDGMFDDDSSSGRSDPNEVIANAATKEIAAGPNGIEDVGENIFDGRPPSHREPTVFDIETEALPDEELAELIPAFAEFDASVVKFGNIKDKAKIEQKIQVAREQHQVDRKKARSKFIDRAALSPMTGKLAAIGYLRGDGETVLDIGVEPLEPEDRTCCEQVMLDAFWDHYVYCRRKKTSLMGFNSNHFDLPFLIRRSWKHRIAVPPSVLVGRYFDKTFVDLMLLFGCGKYGDFVRLDTVARFFGVGGKPDNCTGADFARLLNGDSGERIAALNYLKNDLTMTWGVAAAMGIVQPLPTPSKKEEKKDDGTTTKEK